MFDIIQIQEILPHRYPLLLVDRITDMEVAKSIKGFKNISISEPAFQGHFPGHPIYPGVMILEGMAQCGGVLALKSSGLTDEQMKDKVKKACARCQQVAVIAYGSSVDEWFKRNSKLKTLKNLEVWQLSTATTDAIQALCERTMQLQLNVMDGEWTLIGDSAQAVIEWEQLK
jgi:3-hydroxymyristoyl/3-hydroxydecanoyl-(acyl carrier protein) dehydratase